MNFHGGENEPKPRGVVTTLDCNPFSSLKEDILLSSFLKRSSESPVSFFFSHCEERNDATRSMGGAYATSNAERRATEGSSTISSIIMRLPRPCEIEYSSWSHIILRRIYLSFHSLISVISYFTGARNDRGEVGRT